MLILLRALCWGQMNEGASLTYGTVVLVNEILIYKSLNFEIPCKVLLDLTLNSSDHIRSFIGNFDGKIEGSI